MLLIVIEEIPLIKGLQRPSIPGSFGTFLIASSDMVSGINSIMQRSLNSNEDS